MHHPFYTEPKNKDLLDRYFLVKLSQPSETVRVKFLSRLDDKDLLRVLIPQRYQRAASKVESQDTWLEGDEPVDNEEAPYFTMEYVKKLDDIAREMRPHHVDPGALFETNIQNEL